MKETVKQSSSLKEMEEKEIQLKLGVTLTPKCFIVPRKNHWAKRIILVFSFIFFDYISTLVFCQASHQEANPYVRIFMENLGIPLGLTLFVVLANLPIYVTLSLDSHIVRIPSKIAAVIEIVLDVIFGWFIAGLHFSGGSSWFWYTPDLTRQVLGAFLYCLMAFLIVKPHKTRYYN